MNDMAHQPAVRIFAGRFGSGKTETAVNYALALARGQAPDGSGLPSRPVAGALRVILIDLDVVTPYFRSRETAARMLDQGVEVVAPSIIGQHLDTPAITPQILGAIEQGQRPVVLDVGGDQQGARALGQFRPAIEKQGYAMYFVVNPFRPFTSTAAGVAASIAEIEASSRLRVTCLVSNPNLIGETTLSGILDGHAQLSDFARQLKLPIAFVCIERSWAGRIETAALSQPILTMDRFFIQPWEDS